MYIKKILLTVCCLIVTISFCYTQKPIILTEEVSFEINRVNCLKDQEYSFKQVLSDTNLQFKPIKSLASFGTNACWVKLDVFNPFSYDVMYAISAYPSFDNELFYKNEHDHNWKKVLGGYLNSNQTTVFGYMPCLFAAQKNTTIYIKLNLEQFKKFKQTINVSLYFQNLAVVQKQSNQRFVWWAITVCIILTFFIYNSYLYFMFRDRVYFFYLLILAGGVCYITGINFYFSLFFDFKYVVVTPKPNGGYNYLPFDRAITQLSIDFILTSFLLFTREYLQTKHNLPKWHKILSYVIIFSNLLLLGIFIPEIIGIIPVSEAIPAISNIVSISVIIFMLVVAILGLRKKIKQAKYYLIAQIVPLLLMLILAIWLFVSEQQNWALNYLPNIALIAQTLTFAIALVARVNMLKNDLHEKELLNNQTALQLSFEQEKNQRLQDKLEHDRKEIEAANQIKLLMKELHHRVKNNLQIVSSLLSLQSYKIQDKSASNAVKEGQQRIEAMSLIHQKLYTTDNVAEVNIKEYINDLIESLIIAFGFKKDDVELQINVTDALLNVDKAIPLSLIINELVTNVFKYAFANTTNPLLTVNLYKHNGEIILLVRDNGKGLDLDIWHSKNHHSFGKELVKTFTKQLDGSLIVKNENGTIFSIQFPL